MDPKLLQLLVCPVTKGSLHYDRERQELVSRSARLAYPVRDGIPVLLESEARALDGEAAPHPAPNPAPHPAGNPAPPSTAPRPGYVVLIPARMASSRLPGKPLADIAGLPLVVRVAQRAMQSAAARCVVAADDARILEACQQHGIEAILTAKAHASGSDRLAEACGLLGLEDDTIIVNLQGDEPLLEPAWLDAVAQLLHTHPEASMGTAACPIHSAEEFHNPNVVKVVCNAQGLARYFSRAPIPVARGGSSDAVPAHALRHIGLYSYRAAFVRRFAALDPAPDETAEQLEQLRALWHGHQIAVHIGSTLPPAGVDTPQDLERVRALFAEIPESTKKGTP